jgi:chromosome segregation ATPase
MFLAANPSFELVRFMQILVWIALPVLLTAVIITIYIDYRKKKSRDPMGEEAETDFILAAPEHFAHHRQDGDYVLFDHSGLIKEYKQRMFYNHARYTALRSDYIALQARYSMLGAGLDISKKTKNIYMRNHQAQLLPAGTGTIDDLTAETKEMTDKLEQLSRSYQRLEEENRFLQEQLSLPSANEEERDKILHRWKEDNKMLREKVAEQEYLEELLEEKKTQITFLQNQLETRIRSQYQAEQQRLQIKEEMERAVSETESLKEESRRQQEHADKLESILCEKEELLETKQQQLSSKLDHITYLENLLHEIKSQNERLAAELADNKDEVFRLQKELDLQCAKTENAEHKLFANRQLIQRLGKELSSSASEEQEPPVVTLRPSYMNKINAEEM